LLQRALVRLQQLGGIGSGTQEERLRRATLLLLSLITSLAGAVWGLPYWLMGFHDVALVPFAYTFIVLFSIIGFVVTERFGLFAWMQLGLLLLLPFVVQWQLGGFVPAGGVMLWSLLAAIGTFVFLGVRKGWAWFGAYLALVLGSLAYDLLFRTPVLPAGVAVPSGRLALVMAILNVTAVSAAEFGLVAYALTELRRERESVERLLRNILPNPIAQRMRAGETAIADRRHRGERPHRPAARGPLPARPTRARGGPRPGRAQHLSSAGAAAGPARVAVPVPAAIIELAPAVLAWQQRAG
jgi:hypothetical protein